MLIYILVVENKINLIREKLDLLKHYQEGM
jgi:hypothetical protein